MPMELKSILDIQKTAVILMHDSKQMNRKKLRQHEMPLEKKVKDLTFNTIGNCILKTEHPAPN